MPSWNGAEGLLQEPLDAPGPRRRWSAEVAGAPALAIEAQMASPREAAAVGERLRRLHGRPDPRRPELLGWAVEGTSAWVLTREPEGGHTLAELLRSGPLTPAEAAAVAWSLLSALEAMHEVRIAHGSVAPDMVRVGDSGEVRLEGGWFLPEARAGSDQLAADVTAAGRTGLAALGISEAGGGPATRAELEAPALSRTMRAVASGASGSNVAGARLALGATAGPLVEPAGLARARTLLGARAGGGVVAVRPPAVSAPPPVAAPAPSARPAVAATPAPGPKPAPEPAAEPAPTPAAAVPARHYVATAADFERSRRPFDWSRLTVPAIAVAVIVLLLATVWAGVSALSRSASPAPAALRSPTPAHTAAPSAAPSSRPSATPTAAPRPSASPTSSGPNFGPASAPPVTGLSIQLSGCAPGGSCASEIVVHTTAAPAANDIAWTVRAYDPCTGTTTDAGSGHFTEQAGWTSIDVNQALTLPAARGQLLVAAVTSAPATAASPSVTVGQGGC